MSIEGQCHFLTLGPMSFIDEGLRLCHTLPDSAKVRVTDNKILSPFHECVPCQVIQGRRRRYGRSGHGRTTFLPKMVLAGPCFRPIMIFYYFFPGIFSADQSLCNNIDK